MTCCPLRLFVCILFIDVALFLSLRGTAIDMVPPITRVYTKL